MKPSQLSRIGFFPCFLLALWLSASASEHAFAQDSLRVYVGTYTEGTNSKGIHMLMFNPETGRLGEPTLAAESVNPSFLAFHPNGKRLCAVNEVGENNGVPGGTVSAFEVDQSTGALRLLDKQPSQGTAPCHLSIDRTGGALLVANYGSGSMGVLHLREDGTMYPYDVTYQGEGSSVNRARQEGPHAHCVRFNPTGQYAVEADLGLDRVHVFLFRPDNTKAPIQLLNTLAIAPGSGPRHVAFHPGGMYLYVLNELALTINQFGFDAEAGQAKLLQTISTLPKDANREGASTAEIVVHPSGKFAYASNRGHDSIAIFAIDPETGKLTAVGHEPTQGKTPRNFNIDPKGRFLLAANQDSGTIVVFAIDQKSGNLTATGQKVDVPAPVCVVFKKEGR